MTVTAADVALAALQPPEYSECMSVSECSDALNQAADRLKPLLQPLGFNYLADASGEGHMPFASGFFAGTVVKIGLVFRKRGTLGCVIYENDHSSMSHDDLLRFLGVQDRQRLVYNDSSMASQARDGGDPIDALMHDLEELASQHLNDPMLMRQFIGRSLNERFPGLSGSETDVEPRRRQEGGFRSAIRRLLETLKLGRRTK
jgi:hypothetical protein